MAWRLRLFFLVITLLVTSYWIIQQNLKSSLFDPVIQSINSIYQPILGWGNSVVDAAFMPFLYINRWFGDRKKLLATSDAHKHLLKEHVQLQYHYNLAKTEIKDLRQQIRAENPKDIKFVTRPVVGMPTDRYFKSLVISLPHEQKLTEGMPVRSPEGLIGRISHINWRTATVRLLSDPQSRVPVKTLLGHSAVLIGRGQAPILVDFEKDTTDEGVKVELKDGDILYTSGVDEIFPNDMPVATVRIKDKDTIAIPLANPIRMKFVQVLINE